MYFLNTLKYLSNTHQIRVLRLRAQVQQVYVKYSFKYAYFGLGLKYSKYASNIIVNTRTSTSCTKYTRICLYLLEYLMYIWCVLSPPGSYANYTHVCLYLLAYLMHIWCVLNPPPSTPIFNCICLRIWYLLVFACVFDAYLTCTQPTRVVRQVHPYLRVFDCVFDAYLTCTQPTGVVRQVHPYLLVFDCVFDVYLMRIWHVLEYGILIQYSRVSVLIYKGGTESSEVSPRRRRRKVEIRWSTVRIWCICTVFDLVFDWEMRTSTCGRTSTTYLMRICVNVKYTQVRAKYA